MRRRTTTATAPTAARAMSSREATALAAALGATAGGGFGAGFHTCVHLQPPCMARDCNV